MRSWRTRVAVAAGILMALSACTNTGSDDTSTNAAATETGTTSEASQTGTSASPSATGSSSPNDGDGTEQVLRPASDDVEECTWDGETMELSGTVVGFSQSEAENNPFRIAETGSIEAEAEAVGVERLITTNANSDLATQVSDIQDLLAQGAELLIVAPLNSEGLEPALDQAASQDVPVITIDRQLTSEPCEDYVTFIGSDFLDQGNRAAEQMIEATGGESQIAILLGAPGNLVTTQRTDGFVEVIEQQEGMEIVAQQTGEFTRQGGQEVTAQLIQANPEINAIYAENDEMALGALQALRDAGRVPGEDVQIVSIDGTREAVEAVVAGEIFAVVESNPRFGPLAFEVAAQYLSGEPVPSQLLIEDGIYTQANAEADVDEAY